MSRLTELALEALERRRADIDAELSALQKNRPKGESAESQGSAGNAPSRGRGGKMKRVRSEKSKQAQRLKMRAYWKKRKAEATKTAAARLVARDEKRTRDNARRRAKAGQVKQNGGE